MRSEPAPKGAPQQFRRPWLARQTLCRRPAGQPRPQMFQTLTVWPGRTFFITVDGDDKIIEFSQT